MRVISQQNCQVSRDKYPEFKEIGGFLLLSTHAGVVHGDMQSRQMFHTGAPPRIAASRPCLNEPNALFPGEFLVKGDQIAAANISASQQDHLVGESGSTCFIAGKGQSDPIRVLDQEFSR